MFSADLSWTDGTVEKVGQRRERRAKQRENSVISSGSSLRKGHTQKKGSLSQLTSFSSVKNSFRRPSTANTAVPQEKPLGTTTSVSSHQFKDPLTQPNVVYSAKLEPKLPSGAPLEPPPPFTSRNGSRPLPGPPVYSQQRAGSPNIVHHAWSIANKVDAENLCQSYEHIKSELLALYHPDDLLRHYKPTFYDDASVTGPVELDASDGCISRNSLSSRRILAGDYIGSEIVPEYKDVQPVIKVEPAVDLPTAIQTNLQLRRRRDQDEVVNPAPPVPPKDKVQAPATNTSKWKPPQSWDVIESQVGVRKILDSDSSEDNNPEVNDRREGITQGSHFQRFVRRMESAGPKIILDRLQEDSESPGDQGMSDELSLEKHLWALTAVQLQCMDRFTRQGYDGSPKHPLPPVLRRRRKILELDGSIGEIYQLSAIYPDSRIYHFTSQASSSSIPLPKQASQHTISTSSSTGNRGTASGSPGALAILPLPYADASIHHVRATRISTLLPVSRLSDLFEECYRILKPGGVLELRLMDAMPERQSTGPLLSSWLDDRLLVGLEQDLRCQRPTLLASKWVRDAGFVPLPVGTDGEAKHGNGQQGLTRCLRLPAATSDVRSGNRDVVAQVGALISQALWKDAWGSFVTENPDEPWWWDVPEILEECREWKTTWDVGTMIMMKRH